MYAVVPISLSTLYLCAVCVCVHVCVLCVCVCVLCVCVHQMVPPVGSEEDPVTAITTKFVKTVYNKQRCPIFCTSVSEVAVVHVLCFIVTEWSSLSL